MRIAGKTLRYAAEFFATLERGMTAERRREDFLDAIERRQAMPGHRNDLASGRARFGPLGIPDADAILPAGKKSHPRRLLARAEQSHTDPIATKRQRRQKTIIKLLATSRFT